MEILTNLLLPLGIFFLGLFWWCRTRRNKFYKNIPGPPPLFFFGNALDLRSTKKMLSTMFSYVKNYGGLVKIEIGPVKRFLLVADYQMLEFILSSTKLLTKSEDYQFLRLWLGSGLLIGHGPKWKKHRKILTPAFHFQILEQFIDVFESCGDILIKKLAQETEKDSVDIVPFVTMCTLDIICESTMGTSINAQIEPKSDYVQSVKEMCRILMERAVSPLQTYDVCYFFTENYRTERKAVRILHDKANSVIEQRKHELQTEQKTIVNDDDTFTTKKRKAFLDLLLEASVDGRPLTQEEIREEVDTFMFAGHDTTATAITFTLYCLANHPDVQKTAFEEQRSIFEDKNDRLVTYADLQNMKYLELVIKETLRLYPSVPLIGRKVLEDLEYENTSIPKDDTLLMFPYAIHRDPKYFSEPEVFNPSRFENTEGKFPYAYIPFSAGPRNCIGQKYAMLEMKSVISKVIRKFELRPSVPEHTLHLVAETVLKSSNGVKISLKLRM